MKVGGYFGFKQCVTKSSFTLNNSIFSPGEQVTVNLRCDNSESRHSIEMFKFKLFRKISYNLPAVMETIEYI